MAEDGDRDDGTVWELDRLQAFVAGARLRCEGAPEEAARALKLLGPHAREVAAKMPLGSQLRAYHSRDRERIADGWRIALDAPGMVATVQARIRIDDRWHDASIDFLSLLDADLRVVLVATRVGEELTAEQEPEQSDSPVVPGSPASWVLLRMAMDGRVLDADGTVEQLTGRTVPELLGTNIIETIHPEDRAAAISLGASAAGQPSVARSIEHRSVRPDGSIVWVESTLTYTLDTNEMKVLLVDVTQRRAERAKLEASRLEIQELAEEFRLLADEVPTGVFRADLQGRVLFANGRFRVLSGPQEVTHLHQLASPEEVWIIEDALIRVLTDTDEPVGAGRDAVQVEFIGRTDGRPRSLRLNALRAAEPQRHSVIGILIDAGPTVELRTKARTDPLTGILNRSAINEHLDSELRSHREVCVMFVDFDGFKEVNDLHGHHAGDEVLRVVARRLRGAVRGTEQVGRYGGDEFVVACTDVETETVASLLGRVEGVLAEPVHFDDTLWQPEASIGVALAVPGDTAAALLRRADAEMYRVKRAKLGGRHGNRRDITDATGGTEAMGDTGDANGS